MQEQLAAHTEQIMRIDTKLNDLESVDKRTAKYVRYFQKEV